MEISKETENIMEITDNHRALGNVQESTEEHHDDRKNPIIDCQWRKSNYMKIFGERFIQKKSY